MAGDEPPTPVDEQARKRHNLRLKNLGYFLVGYKSLERGEPPILKSAVGKKLSAQLDRDVVDLRSLARLPTTMASITTLFDQSWREAWATWRQRFDPNHPLASMANMSDEEIGHNLQAVQPLVDQLAIRIAQDKLAQSELPKSFSVQSLPYNIIYSNYQERVDLFLSLSPSGYECGLQFLATLCVRAWTIFEVLAGDLWVEVLDSNPEVLGKSAAEYDRREAGDAESVISGNKNKKNDPDVKGRTIQVPLDALVSCNWNLANRLGTYCKEKFNFQTFEKIKEAYEYVWPKPYAGRIHEIFDIGLREVAAIRNVIVHNGGEVDEKFKRQLAPENPLRDLPINQHIPLDGRMAMRLADMATRKAQGLITLVDDSLRPVAGQQGS